MKIGIIGADTTHTLAFAKKIIAHDTCELAWIDIRNYTTLAFSQKRAPGIVAQLHDLGIKCVEGYLRDDVDAYCILNLDASSHRKIIDEICVYGKPIFVDKPIFYTLAEFGNISVPLFSSSALRYCSFMKRAQNSIKRDNHAIQIEGPLSFVEGIEGYFWYGIHLLEMLHALSDAPLVIENVVQEDAYEIVTGTSGGFEFTLKGITVGDPSFKVSFGTETYDISDDDEAIYDNLIDEIIEFFNDKQDRVKGEFIIDAILTINRMRR